MIEKCPLISVIVPVYNVGEFLIPCLDSLKAQTYENLEILLINDGSTDGSGERCDAYADTDNRFKVIHKENGGVSSARNLGLDMAKGAYIAFVDADDRVLPDYLEVLYRDLTEQNVDAAFCDFMLIDEDGNELPSARLMRFQEKMRICDFRALLAYGQRIRSACCCLFSVSSLKEHRFSSMRFGEDSLFIYEWLCTNPSISGNPYKGYVYLQRQTSATHTVLIPQLTRKLEHLSLDSYLFLSLPIKEPAIQKPYVKQYAKTIHAVASAACLAGRSEDLKAHITNVLPYRKLLPKKFRYALLLYKNAPRLYNILVRINQTLRG